MGLAASGARAGEGASADTHLYAPNEPHPAVVTTIGPVSAYACASPHSAGPSEAAALEQLKSRLKAVGANGLIDLAFKTVAQDPKKRCRRQTVARGKAVIFETRDAAVEEKDSPR